MNKKILFIENCDYENFPVGGQHSFIKAIVANTSLNVFLAGVTLQDDVVINEWGSKKCLGKERPFFAFGKVESDKVFKYLPKRIHYYRLIKLASKRMLSCRPDAIYVQSVESIMPLLDIPDLPPVIFRLAGAYNPLSHSRFSWARHPIFQFLYEKLLLAKVLRNAFCVIAINDDCLALCHRLQKKQKIYSKKISLGVDRGIFFPSDNCIELRREFDVPKDMLVVICVGRLASVKGLDLALELIKLISKNRDVRLFLVGDGEDRSYLEEKCKDMGIRDHVKFCGKQTHKNLAKLLNISDIFFMSSLAEGIPNAMLEAMACRRVVVASNVGGIPEIITSGINGIIFDNRDPHAVLELFNDAIANKLELSTNAEKTIIEKFSIASSVRKIEKIVQEAYDSRD